MPNKPKKVEKRKENNNKNGFIWFFLFIYPSPYGALLTCHSSFHTSMNNFFNRPVMNHCTINTGDTRVIFISGTTKLELP